MNARLRQLTEQFSSHGINACLICHNPNISYLTHFFSIDSWLFVTKKKAYYITDSRYIEEVRKGLKNISLKEHKGSLIAAVIELADKDKIKSVGIDENHVSLSLHKCLLKAAPSRLKFKSANGVVEKLRVCKEDAEIRQIKQALKIHQEALKYLKRIIRPGRTEYEILNKLRRFVDERRVGFSFDPIIASGPNSAFPHAHVTHRKIRTNDVVLVDMGIDYHGYKSDLTRMFYLGKISKLVEDVGTYVSIAQQKAINAIAPGVPVSRIDDAARHFLEEKGLAKYFGHALGHGVGLEIHEAPRLSKRSNEILQEGMVVTVEPAVYLPNKFGVRLEEMVLVTKKGHKVLSDSID